MTFISSLLLFSIIFTNTNMANEIKLSDLQDFLSKNRWEVIDKLIQDDAGNNILSQYEGFILTHAALSGKINVVKFYLDRGTDINKRLASGFTVLNLAVRAGQTELARYLINEGADLYSQTDEEMTPIMFAVLHNRPEIEILLLEKGVSKDAFTETIRGDIQAVKAYLVEDPNLISQYRGHFSLLHWAAYKGHYHLVEMLIKKSADVNGHKEYATPLFWAVRYNRVDIAKLLVDNGADVNLKNTKGQTVLFISARLKITKFLLENGADPKVSDISGNTPLHGIGTHKMHKEAIRTIIDFSGHPNFPQSEAVTQEAINEQLGIAKLLVHNGADPKFKNKEGKTALDFAYEGGFQPIIRFLEAEQDKL